MYTYSFEKLIVWQDSKNLVIHLYNICKQFPNDEKFELSSQIKRAAVSVSSNLAEGTSRKSSLLMNLNTSTKLTMKIHVHK